MPSNTPHACDNPEVEHPGFACNHPAPTECGATYPPLAGVACTLDVEHDGAHEDHSGADERGEILAWPSDEQRYARADVLADRLTFRRTSPLTDERVALDEAHELRAVVTRTPGTSGRRYYWRVETFGQLLADGFTDTMRDARRECVLVHAYVTPEHA